MGLLIAYRLGMGLAGGMGLLIAYRRHMGCSAFAAYSDRNCERVVFKSYVYRRFPTGHHWRPWFFQWLGVSSKRANSANADPNSTKTEMAGGVRPAGSLTPNAGETRANESKLKVAAPWRGV